ncbi:MAG TPA: hypothetical protein VE263_02580 [Candidatus Angelobacter sp.]|nr:hypothetical protein [Candidatus Angelobacter sp.]
MKRFVLFLLVVPFLLAGTAAAQDLGVNKSKPVTLSGKVSEDGKNVIAKNGQTWLVTNPATLSGHEGQQVKVKCRISSDSHNLLVLSLKAVAVQTRYAVNPGDSAFRR